MSFINVLSQNLKLNTKWDSVSVKEHFLTIILSLLQVDCSSFLFDFYFSY